MSQHKHPKYQHPRQSSHPRRERAPQPRQNQSLYSDASERTEIHTDIASLARPQQHRPQPQQHRPQPQQHRPQPTADADERTEIQSNIDVDAARAIARAKFGYDNQNTFDDDDRTEYGQPSPLFARQPQSRFATQAAQPVRTQRPASTARPQPTAQNHNPQPRHTQHNPAIRSPHANRAVQQPQQSPNVSGNYAAVSNQAPHRSGGYPQVQHTPSALEEATEVQRDAATEPHQSAYRQPTQEPVRTHHTTAPTASEPQAPVATPAPQLQLGKVSLENESSIFNPKTLRKVEFLKEETGVDFDPLAMSSPNLNALMLAMGAQELAPELLDEGNNPAQATPLSKKWGDPSTPPSKAMRINYAIWTALGTFIFAMTAMVMLCTITGITLSSLGMIKYLVIFLCTIAGAALGARQPRKLEAILLKTKPLPTSSP